MTSSMKGFRCWSAASVRRTVYSDIGALASDADAVFLAAHTPMVLSHLKGEELPNPGSGERHVLAALLAGVGDADRNTLVAVTGASGAGKSHVVRWVHAHLDPAEQRFHTLYVPRAVQTVRELLRQVVTGLPGGGGDELLERIDAAVGNTTPAELQDRLLEEMRFSLTWTLEPRPPSENESAEERSAREDRNSLLGDLDNQGKRRNGLADLLSLPPVNRVLLRPEGRLHQLVESVYSATSRRDEQQETFGRADLPLREPGVRAALTGNRDLRELWEIVRREPEPALDVLDEALRQAVPRTLGLRAHNGETLDSLFRRSRRALREEGKELVLLFEDLAQFGLVDGELYDQFATQPGSDLAPLRVLFAVTNDPYSKLPETVQTRITHRFAVDSSSLTDRETFVARYLNLVRIGRASVEAEWSQAQRAEADDWVRNACDTREDGLPCRFRDECHDGFGTVDVPRVGRIGLYPYNKVALRRSLDGAERRAREERGAALTPRDVVEVCISETLIEADAHIDRSTYPHERVRDRFDRTVRQAKDAILGGRTGEQAERLYRALVFWGDEAGIAPVVANAFSLDTPATQESVTPQPPVSQEHRARPNAAAEASQPSPLLPLFQWQNRDRLPDEDADYYRQVLHHLVFSRLDLDQDLFHVVSGEGSEIISRIFNRMSFDLEDARGRVAGAGSVRFRVGRNAEDMRVLMGARWFADHGHWQPDNGTWPWPEGNEPVDLMLSLECRLEQWADTVRRSFRGLVQGRGLARAAVGTRGVALLATGLSPDLVRNVDDVLSIGTSSTMPSIAEWAAADRMARDVLRRVPAADLVGQFAAVRQGDTGAPQLVDAVDLHAGLQEALQSPVTHLRSVVVDFGDAAPALAEAARDLLTTIEQATPNLLREVADAVESLGASLEGQQPRTVAQAAREVGRRALDSGLFRPADGWNRFAESVDALETLPAGLPLEWRGGDQESAADEALAVQHWARAAVAGARALEVVRQAMAATLQECRRSRDVVGDLDQRAQEVRKKLSQVEGQLRTLGTSEAQHG